MKPKKSIRLRAYEECHDTAYVELQDHPHELTGGIVARTINLHDLIDDYDGPNLVLEFNEFNRPIGIEILYPSQNQDDEAP